MENLAQNKNIIAGRNIYKPLGENPNKYRTFGEALLRHLIQRKGLYFINNILDINNILSIKTFCSCGSYNLKKISIPIYFSVVKPQEKYKGIGKDVINIENLPIFKDQEKSFGSTSSDSEKAMITKNTKEILTCIFSFDGDNTLEETLNYTKKLMSKLANGKNLQLGIVK